MTTISSLQDALEQRQISIYLVCMFSGLLLGYLLPGSFSVDSILNPALALMMFVTFLQIPLAGLLQTLLQRRFLYALLLANFVFIPAIVWMLLPLAPADPYIRFAFALVLLAPCIDYVIVFSHLGRADARSLLAATPLLLMAQVLALPLLLQHVFSINITALLDPSQVLHTFFWIVALPLVAAATTQLLANKSLFIRGVMSCFGLLPVPATALVLLIVVAMALPQASTVGHAAWRLLLIYMLYALLAPLAGWLAARLLSLPKSQQRSVAFSAATRNSLLVLPVAVAIPEAGALVAAVIVMQTLVELISEIFYIRWIPRFIREKNK